MDFIQEKTIAAEMSLLGAALLDSEKLAEIVPADPSLFLNPDFGAAFGAATALFSKGQGVDPITVSQSLTGAPRTGGSWIKLLNDCFTSTPSAQNIMHYNEAVVEAGLKRRLKNEVLKSFGDSDGKDFSESKELVIAAAESVESNSKDDGFYTMNEMGLEFLHQVDDRMEGRIQSFSTGYETMDEKLNGGFEGGDLVIVAGRPGMGKTAITLNLAANMALDGCVVYYSLEMRRHKLMGRLCAMFGGMNLGFAKNPNRYDEAEQNAQINRIHKATEVTERLNLLVNDDAATTIHSIKSQCRKLQRKTGLKAIFVDYLELLRGYDEGHERLDVVLGKYTRDLKLLANELGIPVFLLCQLNRECEKRPDKRPQLSDLKNSGGIEQDADIVLMMYRDEYYNPDTEYKNVCEVLFRKFRDGEAGQTLPMEFDGRTQRFHDLDMSNIISFERAKEQAEENKRRPNREGLR